VPATVSLLERRRKIKILSAHRLTPPVMRFTLEKHGKGNINGIIAPGHVSAVIGARAWEFLPNEYGIPTVVSGFEPLDVLISIMELLRMLREKRARLINTYSRVVRYEGNPKAQMAIEKWFEVRDAAWRGFGRIPNSGLFLRERWKQFDAFHEFGLKDEENQNDTLPGCRCAEITLGMALPTDCPHFMRGCTPERPYGPCMVSIEGTCRMWAMSLGKKAKRITITGIVQGVGFRPFVFKLASELDLKGYVKNMGGSEVIVHVEGGEDEINELIRKIRLHHPPRALIERIEAKEVPAEG